MFKKAFFLIVEREATRVFDTQAAAYRAAREASQTGKKVGLYEGELMSRLGWDHAEQQPA